MHRGSRYVKSGPRTPDEKVWRSMAGAPRTKRGTSSGYLPPLAHAGTDLGASAGVARFVSAPESVDEALRLAAAAMYAAKAAGGGSLEVAAEGAARS